MIVCSCNAITLAQIRRVVEELHAGPVPRVITPSVVYRALGHRPQCGSCLGAVAEVIDQSLQGCCCAGKCKLES